MARGAPCSIRARTGIESACAPISPSKYVRKSGLLVSVLTQERQRPTRTILSRSAHTSGYTQPPSRKPSNILFLFGETEPCQVRKHAKQHLEMLRYQAQLAPSALRIRELAGREQRAHGDPPRRTEPIFRDDELEVYRARPPGKVPELHHGR